MTADTTRVWVTEQHIPTLMLGDGDRDARLTRIEDGMIRAAQRQAGYVHDTVLDVKRAKITRVGDPDGVTVRIEVPEREGLW